MGLMETNTKPKFNLVKQLVLVDARKDSLTLTWPPEKNAVKYIIDFRLIEDGEDPKKDAEAEFDRISDSLKGTLCRKKNLKPETEYFFRVAPVVWDKKKSKYMKKEWIRHKQPFETLSQEQDDDFSMLPPIVTVPAETDSLIVTWEEVTEQIYGFELQMRENRGGARWFKINDALESNEIQRYNLTSQWGYQFRVRPLTDYTEPFSPPSDPVVPRFANGEGQQAQYYPRTPYKPKEPSKEDVEEESSSYDEEDSYEDEDGTWYYSQEGNGEEEYNSNVEEDEDDHQEPYFADERQAAPSHQSTRGLHRRRGQPTTEHEEPMPSPWFKVATDGTPNSAMICWQEQQGCISGYELQMKELHYELVNKKLEDHSSDWKTIAPCLVGVQVKKKNLTSEYGYQFRVRPLDGPKSEIGFSNPSNPVILPGASSTVRSRHASRQSTSNSSNMPAPWFKGVPDGGEKHAIIVCWQPQQGVTGYELQMREMSTSKRSTPGETTWATIAANFKGTQVKKKNLTSPYGYQFRIRPVDGPDSASKGFSKASTTAICS